MTQTNSSSTKPYFGTDGVRGKAGVGKLSSTQVLRLGLSVGTVLDEPGAQVVIGRDTRASGDMIEAALIAGLTAKGIEVLKLGVLPTPAVALTTRDSHAVCGIMITASHNKYMDNGIKLFGADGTKISPQVEAAIETLMAGEADATSQDFGRVSEDRSAVGTYVAHMIDSVSIHKLGGLHIVLDCANGAAFETAPQVLQGLGVGKLTVIGVEPDGLNINAGCGSTETDILCETVVNSGADIGIALDGDADRLIICDEKGQKIDGDQIMGFLAARYKEKGKLTQPGLVATVMSNLGLERYLKEQGLTLVRTAVGDKYVAAAMREQGYNIGGEQSGHMLLADYAPTGDGTLAAIHVLAELEAGTPVSEQLSVFTPVPQQLKNVRYEGVSPLTLDNVKDAITAANADMGDSGRILVRASGTEPLIRVMAEGDDLDKVERVTDALCDVIRSSQS